MQVLYSFKRLKKKSYLSKLHFKVKSVLKIESMKDVYPTVLLPKDETSETT